MNNRKKLKNLTSDGFAYLTKRMVVSKAQSAGKKAADSAMNIMGYVVIAHNGTVIKKYANGDSELIEQLQ